MPRDLRDDVRGGPEAVEADPPRVAGHPQRAVADEARAQPGREFLVREAVRKREAIARVGQRELRVAAVDRIAGEARRVAEIFASGDAVSALAARPREPRNADALADAEPRDVRAQRGDGAHDFMARDDGGARVRQLAVHDVQVGAADAARVDAHQHLAGAGNRVGHVLAVERAARRPQDHRKHAFLPRGTPRVRSARVFPVRRRRGSWACQALVSTSRFNATGSRILMMRPCTWITPSRCRRDSSRLTVSSLRPRKLPISSRVIRSTYSDDE